MKKILAIILSLIIVAALFAGCGESTTTDTDSKPVSQEEKPQEENPTDNIDFEGGTVKFACWVDGTPKLGNSAAGDAEYYAEEWAKEKYNVGQVEYYTSASDAVQKEEFVKASLAGQHYADIFMAHSWFYGEYISNDLLQPVTEYITTFMPEHFDLILPKYKKDIWGFIQSYGIVTPNNYFVYNTDLIAQSNLEDPQKLDLEGKWTWDVFADYCKEAKKIPGGKGVGSFNIHEVLLNSANFTYTHYDEKEDKYYSSFVHPDTKDLAADLIGFINQLVNVDKTVLGTFCAGHSPAAEADQAFQEGKLMFCFGGGSAYKTLGMNNYKPVQYPTPEENYDRYNTVNAFVFASIPASANYPVRDLAYFWMDRLCVWDESRGDAFLELDIEEKIEQKEEDKEKEE